MQLHVRVVDATGLIRFNGKSDYDPFVSLSVGDHVFKTKVVDSTSHPYWNEEFHFSVSNHRSDVLDIVIKDKDAMSEDDIGKASVTLSSLSIGTVQDMWISISSLSSLKNGAKIHLVLHLAQNGIPAFQNVYQQQSFPQPNQHQRNGGGGMGVGLPQMPNTSFQYQYGPGMPQPQMNNGFPQPQMNNGFPQPTWGFQPNSPPNGFPQPNYNNQFSNGFPQPPNQNQPNGYYQNTYGNQNGYFQRPDQSGFSFSFSTK